MIIPNEVYSELPCSVVAMGCALGLTDKRAVTALISPQLHRDGYLSLKGMEALILANKAIDCKLYYKRADRPTLKAFMARYKGRKAIVCLLGHFIYFDGNDYYSYFMNDNDPVVQAWFLED